MKCSLCVSLPMCIASHVYCLTSSSLLVQQEPSWLLRSQTSAQGLSSDLRSASAMDLGSPSLLSSSPIFMPCRHEKEQGQSLIQQRNFPAAADPVQKSLSAPVPSHQAMPMKPASMALLPLVNKLSVDLTAGRSSTAPLIGEKRPRGRPRKNPLLPPVGDVSFVHGLGQKRVKFSVNIVAV